MCVCVCVVPGLFHGYPIFRTILKSFQCIVLYYLIIKYTLFGLMRIVII